MKTKIFQLLFILIIISNIQGQINNPFGSLLFKDTIDFTPQHSWLNIPDTNSNIWEIGNPNKVFFNSGHLDDIAIVTDTENYYNNNCNDFFTITIPCNYQYGEIILSFYHKYDTDTLIDGGIIEISYDNGNTWVNVIDDIAHLSTNFIGLYEDTIMNNEYGFSGKSDNWQYVELYWFWDATTKKKTSSKFYETIIIKFRFKSDNINTNKEGWMIDNLVFSGYSIVGNISEITNNIQIYPNPASDFINIKTKNYDKTKISIFNISGELLINKYFINNTKLDIKNLKKGIYFIKIETDKEIITKKLIKE